MFAINKAIVSQNCAEKITNNINNFTIKLEI